MRETLLTQKHRDLGAKIVDFAGFAMPLQYQGVKQEHHQIRNHAGVFDVSHMGEFVVKGREALELVQKVTTNDASKLKIGQAQYSCMTRETGGIIDDLLVYRLDEDQCSEGEQAYMLVVNAANIDKDFAWIESQNTFDTRLINISQQTGLLAVQGPKASDLLQQFTEIDLAQIKYYHFTKGVLAGHQNMLISATGYTGEKGFELYGAPQSIANIWDLLVGDGEHGIFKPAGLGARDTLRLEMGYCLYGNDIDDQTTPLEAGLGWITKFKKGHFLGSESLAKQKQTGLVRRLVGVSLHDRRVPRQGYPILDSDMNEIGKITSGTFSPSLDQPIGMGYVKSEFANELSEVLIDSGRKHFAATVVKTPFLKKS